MTPDDAERWTFEQRLVENALAELAARQRDLLARLGWPTDAVDVYNILHGFKAPPATASRSPADRQQAKRAMLALGLIVQVRGALSPGNENPRLAAYWALLAAEVAVTTSEVAERLAVDVLTGAHKGGRVRGQQQKATSRGNEAQVRRYWQRWMNSVELQLQYSRAATYVRKMTPSLSARTVRRYLSKIKSGQ